MMSADICKRSYLVRPRRRCRNRDGKEQIMSTESAAVRRTDDETTRGATLVTGASSGIGYELARLFAADGDDLVLVARRESRLEALAADLRAKYGVGATVVPLDLTGANAVDELIDAVDGAALHVDTLVNNAGFGVHGPYHETDAEVERSMLDLNVVALTELTKRVIPGMVERGSGRILNVASIAAVYPSPTGAVYAATKAYVLSYSVALAEELRPHGVTVTALCPGTTDTEWFDHGGVENSGLVSQKKATANSVARVGVDALTAGEAIAVPTTAGKALWHATRLLPRTRVAKIAADYWAA
jgi:hypothetical protein